MAPLPMSLFVVAELPGRIPPSLLSALMVFLIHFKAIPATDYLLFFLREQILIARSEGMFFLILGCSSFAILIRISYSCDRIGGGSPVAL